MTYLNMALPQFDRVHIPGREDPLLVDVKAVAFVELQIVPG